MPPSFLVADSMGSVGDNRGPTYVAALPSLSERLGTWNLPPFDSSDLPSGHIARSSLLHHVRHKARHDGFALPAAIEEMVQLRRFILMCKSTEVHVDAASQVRVEVSTQQDEMHLRKFTYRVRMNLLPSSKHASVTLTHRTLLFQDADGVTLQQVNKDPKVVGQSPKLKLGEKPFQYFSFYDDAQALQQSRDVPIVSNVASPLVHAGQPRELCMSGAYFFRTPDDEEIVVPVPRTRMLRLLSR